MSKKLVAAKSPKNVLTETNPNNLTYSSDFGSLKYFKSGSFQVILNGSSTFPQEHKIDHNLGYFPFFTAFSDAGLNFTPLRNYPLSYMFADAGVFFNLYAYCTSSQLIFRIESSGVAGTVTVNFYYKIFRNNLNL